MHAAQAKLLRALEDRTITRVGENAPRRVDERVVAAANRPLDELVADGGFREDLLYRLRVITLQLPPLRERREDIAALAASLRPADAALARVPYAEARARALDAFDRAFLVAALEHNGGNVSRTARALGLHRQSLQKMLRRLGLGGGE